MLINELQNYTFAAKYARWLPEEKRRETWGESCDRVKEMMLEFYKDKNVEEEINWAYSKWKDKTCVGSQRSLQFGGAPVLKHHARQYNCCASYCDRARFFQECMYLLLCGCGTGFSVQKHHIAKLPKIQRSNPKNKKFIIEDSIEGWADSIGVLISSYMSGPFQEYLNKKVDFDFSKIRPAGSSLSSSSSGKAPGPEPLKKSLEKITEILDARIDSGFLRPIDAYDIVMHLSDAVLSGGVRRSATICIFSKDDEEMYNAKIGDWFYKNPQRGRSNNSVLLLRDSTSFEEFKEIIESTKQYGEPGFIWSDSTEQLYNPCLRGSTRLSTENGLIKIEDLALEGNENILVCDSRALKDKVLFNNFGTIKRAASKAKITQKNAEIFRVTTGRGYYVETTNNHTFITKSGRKLLKDIIIGDEILLQSGEGSFGQEGNYNEGLILGLVTSDGYLSNHEAMQAKVSIWEDDFEDVDLIQSAFSEVALSVKTKIRTSDSYTTNLLKQTKIGNKEKLNLSSVRVGRLFKEKLGIEEPKSIKERVPECVFRGSKEFVIGYLHGMFFGDGTCYESGSENKSTISVRLNQSNKALLQDIQIILQNFGICSSIYERRPAQERFLPGGDRKPKLYKCKANYDLVMNRPDWKIFVERVGLIGRKAKILDRLIENRIYSRETNSKFTDKIVSIEYVGREDVYCLNEPETNSIISNGIVNGQCVEASLFGYDENGNSGWQFCNLTSINGKKIKSYDDFELAVTAAAIIGTLQAGFTSFPYLGEVTENITKKEALLGISITGIMDSPDILLNPKYQELAAKHAIEVNKKLASKLGINPATRLTNIKPEGTTSCVLGTASGIHPHHAKRYIRRVQANKMEDIYQFFKMHNPKACEESVWSNNNSDDVISFCIEVEDGAKVKNQMSAIDLLNTVKLTQQNWVEYGTVKEKLSAPYLKHNVSNTINVKPEEWDEVTRFIYENRQWFAGISLLPITGDKDYAQAPFTAIYLPNEMIRHYGDGIMFVSGLIETALELWEDNLWGACDTILFGNSVKGAAKKEWKERCIKFANKYFSGDLKKLTYAMKDIYNYKMWTELNISYQKVDYSLLYEDKDNTKDIENIACAGGSCSII